MTDVSPRDGGTFAEGDVHSTAFGFFSHIAGSVDPRTGMYSAAIEIPTGEGNHLRGPHFVFRLAYSSLSAIDDGFGQGWRLGVSEIDVHNNVLRLSDGESQAFINQGTGQPVIFRRRKLESCRLTLGRTSAVVEHATGVVEHLETPGDLPGFLRLKRLVNPNGDFIELFWARHPTTGTSALDRVIDRNGTELLSATYLRGEPATVTIATGTASKMTLQFSRSGSPARLERVVIPTINELNLLSTRAEDAVAWNFEYTSAPGPTVSLLRAMESPDGIRESVIYREDALKLPGGLLAMPAVTRLERRLLIDPETVFLAQDYTWPVNGNNFYGYPAVPAWKAGEDGLIDLVGNDFRYESHERQVSGNTELCRIDRVYNQFHLVTNEKTTRGNLVQEVDIEYGNIPGTSFTDQPDNFQLPRRVTTGLFLDSTDPRVEQKTVVTSTYDDHGNLTSRHTSATDLTESSAYYPLTGDGIACPPDPTGMVRRIKSSTLTPGVAGGPASAVSYTYRKLPLRAGSEAMFAHREATYYVQAEGEVHTIDGIVQSVIDRLYFDDPTDDRHGTLAGEVTSQGGVEERRQYAQEVSNETITLSTLRSVPNNPSEPLSASNQITSRSIETRALVSGLVVEIRDALGNLTEFAYDALGRLIREVSSPDASDYTTTVGMRYQLSAVDRWVERTGTTGLRHRTVYDALGRVVRNEEPLPDGSLVTVSDTTYDIFGRPAMERVHDILPAAHVRGRGDGVGAADTQTTLTLAAHYEYDDWGEPCRVQAADGSVAFSERTFVEVDAGSRTPEVWLRTTAWRISADSAAATGWQFTDVDAAGNQRLVSVGSGAPVGREVSAAGSWTYDGLGRCTSHTDAMGLVTTQTWDALDRLVTTSLPGGDVVTRTYAPGQAGEQLATISITPFGEAQIVLGRREYDGLGRLTREEAGSLTSRFDYVEGQIKPSASHLPGGGTLEHVYDPKLGEVLLGETLKGRADYVKTATYDKRLGLPTEVSSAIGSMAIFTDYLGRMTVQAIEIDGDVPRHSATSVSLGGRELVRRFARDPLIDDMGTTIQTLVYDTVGRVVTVEDGDVSVTLDYDGLSRISSRVTTDSRSRRTIRQQLTYDALGRIERTTFQHDVDDTVIEHSLVLGYREDNKVVSKKWVDSADEANPLRTEAMAYDDRGRLIDHAITAVGSGAYPTDDRGNPFTRQSFEYGALDNLLEVRTALLDGRMNTTTYSYDTTDPDRVSRLSNSLEDYPGSHTPIELRYDGNGHLTSDGQGHTLQWDEAGRLMSVDTPDGKTLAYDYGPDGRVARVVSAGHTTVRYHSDGKIHCEVTGEDNRRYIRIGTTVVAETRLAGAIRTTWLLGSDPQGSILTESSNDAINGAGR